MSSRNDDLVVLVADKDMEYTLKGLLTRHHSLGIKEIKYQIIPHPEHDGGCRKTGVDLLRNYTRTADFALMIFDWEGSGSKQTTPQELETDLERELAANGWQDRNAVVVIEPELENWIWANSRQVDQILRWPDKLPGLGGLREWLVENGWAEHHAHKPARPKEAFRAALKQLKSPVSAILFKKLADKVSFKNCQDRAFLRLMDILKNWFSNDLEMRNLS